MDNDDKRRLLNRVERLAFALGILLIVGLANYYRSLPAFTTDSQTSDPNVLLTSPVTDSIVCFGGPRPTRITLEPYSGTIQSI